MRSLTIPRGLAALLSTTLAVICLSQASATAAPIVAPPGLGPNDPYRLVFVTVASGPSQGGPANIADYDSFVTADALLQPELVALGTTWRVLGSTFSDHAKDHTQTNEAVATDPDVPIYNLNGELVASGNAQLWSGALANAVGFARDGTPYGGFAWTGSTAAGFSRVPNHLGSPGSIAVGSASATDDSWMIAATALFAVAPFYAISDVLVASPEPGGLGMVVLAGLAAWVRQQRR